MFAIFTLHIRHVLAGRRRWLLALTFSLPCLLTLAIALDGEFGRIDDRVRIAIASALLFAYFAVGASGLGALLFGTSILGAEVQAKTLTYLFTRSVRREFVILGKYLANVCVLGFGALVALLVGWALLLPGEWRILGALAVAVLLSTVAYHALMALIGSVFSQKSMLAGWILLGLEVMLSMVPAFVRELTVMYHVRSVAFDLSGIDSQELDEFRQFAFSGDIVGSLLAIAGVTLGALILNALVVVRREYSLAETP